MVQHLENAIHERASSEYRQGVRATVGEALRSTSFASRLVPALSSLHYTDQPGSRQSALTSTPELSAVSLLRHGLQGVQSARSQLLIYHEPRMSIAATTPGTPTLGVLWRVAAFVESLGRLAPLELMAAVQEPLIEWSKLSSEVCRRFLHTTLAAFCS